MAKHWLSPASLLSCRAENQIAVVHYKRSLAKNFQLIGKMEYNF